MRILYAVVFLALLLPARAVGSGPQSGLGKFLQKNVRFEENRGQIADLDGKPVHDVFYRAAAPGVDVYLTRKGLTYVFSELAADPRDPAAAGKQGKNSPGIYRWNAVDLQLSGAVISPENIVAGGVSDYHYNYFLGHCPQGIYGVRSFDTVTVRNVYPGIDWIIYNSAPGGLKYDFVVNAGADAALIRLEYKSLFPATLGEEGNISLQTGMGLIVEAAPVSYAVSTPEVIHTPVVSAFRKLARKRSGEVYTETFVFDIGPYDREKMLVIDPQLTWSTFYGGSSDDLTTSIECDAAGNVFTAGTTASFNLPVLNSSTFYQGTKGGLSSQFIMKFNASNSLVWATFYGGSGAGVYQSANDIALDASGNVFMCGTTNATNYPVQNNSNYFQATLAGVDDACIVKFDNTGVRLWATYFGGSSVEAGNSLSVDGSGNVFMTGTSQSTNMPLMNGGTYYQATFTASTAGMIVKFSNSGALIWSTFFEGLNPLASAIDNSGNLYLTGASASGLVVQNPGGGAFFQGTGGAECAIVKFANNGALLWSTFFGGSGLIDQGKSITTDKFGNLFVTGVTTSTNFPLQNAGGYFQNSLGSSGLTISDVFISKFAPGGVLVWSTFFGGGDLDGFFSNNNLVTDTCGNLFLSFYTKSSNLFTTPACEGGFIDSVFDFVNAASTDLFIARFDTSTSCNWASYAGGNGNDTRASLAVAPNGHLYMTGQWTAPYNQSANYPLVGGETKYMDSTANGATDIYFMKFSPGVSTPTLSFGAAKMCSGDTGVYLPQSFLPSGGTYSAAPGLSIHPVNGAIIPGASSPGTYTVTYTFSYSTCVCYGAASGTSVAATTVTIAATPTLAVFAQGPVCAGVPAALLVTGAQTYTWSNFAQGDTLIVSPAVTSVFTVTGTGAAGCKSTATVQLVIIQPAALTVAGPTLICAGDSAVLVASAAMSYSWSSGGLSPAVVVKPSSFTIFTVTATDSSGCKVSAIKSVSVIPLPVYPVTGPSTVCAGANATLHVLAPSSVSHSWSSGSTQTAIIVTPAVSTVYSNTLTGQGGCVYIASHTLIVVPLPSVSIAGPTVVCAGSVFSATASGAQSFTWSDHSGSATYSQVITVTQTVFVTGESFGCTDHDTLVVNVSPVPVLTVTPSGITACSGDSFTAAVSGASGYSWSNGASGPVATFTAGPGLTYIVTGTNLPGCSATASIAVTVNLCSGLSEMISGVRVKVFPNPNDGAFTVVASAALELSLFNELGQLVRKLILTEENSFTAHAGDLAAGVYMLTESGDKTVDGYKIVVNGR